MKVMKRVALGALIVFSIAFLGFCVSVVLEDDSPPVLPQESEPNKLIITSNGCCFWVGNMEVLLQNAEGDHITLASNDRVDEHDIFHYDIPSFEGSKIELIVKFRAFYEDECGFSTTVMTMDNIAAMQEAGVLLYFSEGDDMYLHVISEDYRVSYKMGSDSDRWKITDVA